MEPLHPDVRKALKEAHPDVTDAVIDRVEALLAERFQLDPAKHADAIRRLDREREALIEQTMPRYVEIVRALSGVRKRPPDPPAAATVILKKTR